MPEGGPCGCLSTSAVSFLAFLLLAVLFCSALADTVQLDVTNVEGPAVPEAFTASPSAWREPYYYDPSTGAAGSGRQQLVVVAVDGTPLNANERGKSERSSSSSTGADQQSPVTPTTPDAVGAAAQAAARPGAAAAAAAAAQIAANPAANAAVAGAVPNLGVPPAGSRIPGRYVVFFNSNVSSLQMGSER